MGSDSDRSSEGENVEGETDTEGEGELDECVTIAFSYISPATGDRLAVYAPVTLNSLTGFSFDQLASSSLDGFLVDNTIDLDIDFNADACGPEAMGDYFTMEMNMYYEQT